MVKRVFKRLVIVVLIIMLLLALLLLICYINHSLQLNKENTAFVPMRKICSA